ncbi:class I SAM-dependent methyltransferase [Rhodobacteraceae bacterium]|nr:class I SAM-dependent methyltransferase [Paracoccaceae bacterium]
MDNVQSSVELITQKMQNSLSENDTAFIRRIFANGLSKYIHRLIEYDFKNQDIVLDAGCGFGQWSLALSTLNTNVFSCDISDDRIKFLQQLCDVGNITNIEAEVSPLTDLPYEDDFFDVVFCYGVIFITDWRRSLSELTRVLKPGGRIYVNANGLGWYIYLWESGHNEVRGYDPKLNAAKAFNNTINYRTNAITSEGQHVIIEPHEMFAELNYHGIDNLEVAGEGLLAKQNPAPFFIDEYKGIKAVYEVIGQKVDVAG